LCHRIELRRHAPARHRSMVKSITPRHLDMARALAGARHAPVHIVRREDNPPPWASRLATRRCGDVVHSSRHGHRDDGTPTWSRTTFRTTLQRGLAFDRQTRGNSGLKSCSGRPSARTNGFAGTTSTSGATSSCVPELFGTVLGTPPRGYGLRQLCHHFLEAGRVQDMHQAARDDETECERSGAQCLVGHAHDRSAANSASRYRSRERPRRSAFRAPTPTASTRRGCAEAATARPVSRPQRGSQAHCRAACRARATRTTSPHDRGTLPGAGWFSSAAFAVRAEVHREEDAGMQRSGCPRRGSASTSRRRQVLLVVEPAGAAHGDVQREVETKGRTRIRRLAHPARTGAPC
jgi:hypothetical protein